tara:strand:+ start:1251 stop:2552 length:1302 start_codon:yes stop_codon:yes gene_type:complete
LNKFFKKFLKKISLCFNFSFISFIDGHEYLDKSDLSKIRSFIGSNKFDNTKEFERRFTKLIGDGEAISFASARMGFYEFMRISGIKEDDEIILCGSTCSVMPNAVKRLGAKPIYSDIDTNTFGSCPNSINESITSKTRLVVAQHSFGIPCQIDEIKKICTMKNILLVEDCALSVGSKLNNRKVGTFGDAAIFSTDHTKPINSIIGGFIYSENQEIINKLKKCQESAKPILVEKQKAIFSQLKIEWMLARKRRYGILKIFNSLMFIFNSFFNKPSPFLDEDADLNFENSTYPYPAKLPEFIAILGLHELDKWDQKKVSRKVSFNKYLEELSKSNLKNFIPGAYYDNNRENMPLRFVFSHPQGNLIRKSLERLVDVEEIWFTKPIINTKSSLHDFNYKNGTCKLSEKYGNGMINLPLFNKTKLEDKIIITLLEKV